MAIPTHQSPPPECTGPATCSPSLKPRLLSPKYTPACPLVLRTNTRTQSGRSIPSGSSRPRGPALPLKPSPRLRLTSRRPSARLCSEADLQSAPAHPQSSLNHSGRLPHWAHSSHPLCWGHSRDQDSSGLPSQGSQFSDGDTDLSPDNDHPSGRAGTGETRRGGQAEPGSQRGLHGERTFY